MLSLHLAARSDNPLRLRLEFSLKPMAPFLPRIEATLAVGANDTTGDRNFSDLVDGEHPTILLGDAYC